MNSGAYVASWLIFNLFIVGVYDLAAYFFFERTVSVSYWLQLWMSDWPMLSVLTGIIIGHLAWPLHRPPRG